ncbi:MAG TPA: PQQ-dependent sugar dehydrogenase [Methylomirabilota bacterium]|nr:PQQ-dependent sugar dehydrogenase [Methylomirabilota bacterium]
MSLPATAANLPSGFTETQFGGNLSGSPTAMAFAPDGRLFVCQQGGQLRVIKTGSLLSTPFVSLTVDSSGERGLLGIAFDPNFATNHYLYVYYTVATSPIHNRVSRFTAAGDTAVPGSETILLELDNLSSATNHNGGAIHFGPDGKLYIGVGENANGANSQTLSNLLGKMLRINADGTIPTDNPFYNTATGNNRAIWALGLRNPFTFAFQPGTTRLFINDVGQSTWEEINDGIAGSNYGWPTTEGPTSNPSFRSPIYYYGHGTTNTTGCAIVGGAFYNPPVPQFPSSYIGTYFFADLCGGWIRIFDPTAGTATGFATGIVNPVDLHVGPDGALYYLAQGSGGQVFRVSALPAQALNISGRARVETGQGVVISGFIVTGTTPKRVGVRALGPSLANFGVSSPLADPIIQLNRGDGSLVMVNDNWKNTQQAEITAAGLAPPDDREAALIVTLSAGNYTAIVSGKNGGTGVTLAEVYDLDQAADSRLANISTRAPIGTGSDVLIGGFITGSKIGATRIAVRALGPTLQRFGIANPLPDPRLELHNANGALLTSNDNWQSDASQAALITGYGLAPPNSLESAIAISLAPGPYTAIVTGKNNQTGIGLIEIYDEQ